MINVQYMKSFVAKLVNSISISLRYLIFKLLKYEENNKKMCNTFDHNFKNIPQKYFKNIVRPRLARGAGSAFGGI